jgi:FtsP/CotA-like multicopper oxidase with cupredoxin domain
MACQTLRQSHIGTFINEDNIRHQFMMHGLPKYLYKYGMFHLEVTGPKTVSGTIIVPGSDDTFLVHCDISHHMEKGMKAQLVVGKGGEIYRVSLD